MSNDVQIFEYIEAQKVRTVTIDGEVWFVAKDVCEVLDLVRSSDGISGLDKEDKDVAVINDTIFAICT